MLVNRTLVSIDKNGFNFDETKKNVWSFFNNVESLEWEWAKLNARKGLKASYDFAEGYQAKSYNQMNKDIFNLSARELTEDQLRDCIFNYYWARSILSEEEQLYIMEYFVGRKYENEIVDMLGFSNSDSNEFKKLKRSAVYKFADYLNLLVLKETKK